MKIFVLALTVLLTACSKEDSFNYKRLHFYKDDDVYRMCQRSYNPRVPQSECMQITQQQYETFKQRAILEMTE